LSDLSKPPRPKRWTKDCYKATQPCLGTFDSSIEQSRSVKSGMRKPKVGIDLGPAAHSAPGTARHVSEQARALFQLDVPWIWVPTVESTANPLWSEIQGLNPVIVPGRKFWSRATFSVGRAWQHAKCSLGFCTAYFVPWSGIPVVTNCFDSNHFEFGSTWIASGKRWNYYLINILSCYALKRSSQIFVNSQYCIDVIASHMPSISHKLVKAPPGVTMPMPEPQIAPHFMRNAKKPFLLYVGVFSENKNQRRLLEAWKQIQSQYPDAPLFIMVGRGDNLYLKKRIYPQVQQLLRPEEVLLPGKVSDKELAWLYHHAMAYVQPSIAEGFGLPIAEAMSYGLPIACSNTTSIPETTGHAAQFFDPYSTNSIVGALKLILNHSELRYELSKQSSQRWKEFTWDVNARIIAESIAKILKL